MSPQQLLPEDAAKARLDGEPAYSLETTVLIQLRDSFMQMSRTMVDMGTKVSTMHDRLLAIEISKFDHKIEDMGGDLTADLRRTQSELQREISNGEKKADDQEAKILALTVLTTRMGAYLAVAGVAGAAAIGALATKVFGG